MVKEKSCGAVVFRKTDKGLKFLLLHYQSGHWDFSKGHMEAGEDEKTTAARELTEETGIKDIRFIEGFREEIKYFFKRENQTVVKEVVFYLAETGTEKITLSYEHIGYTWLEYEDSMKKITFQNSKDILKKAMDFLSKQTQVN
jgi:bis(5'-nucleosidyl)-tetraphosphatase